MKHGMCTVGTSLVQAMNEAITWSFEFRLTILLQIIKIDLLLSEICTSSQSSEMNYLTIINTSLACYHQRKWTLLNVDTYLPCGDNEDGSAICHIHKITIRLDYNKKICTCARIQQVESDKHEMVVEDTKENSAILFACCSWKGHVAVHYFANGVAETKNIWSLASQSLPPIQSLNC